MILQNQSLLPHNTFGIEAIAQEYAEYSSIDELRDIVALLQQKRKLAPRYRTLHIGGGSNLLFTSNFDGMIIHNAIKGIDVLNDSKETVIIRVGGGVVWDELVEETIRRGWYGLENLSLIPGEVGASAVQNIGAYGAEAKDYIYKVELVDLNTGVQTIMENADCKYAYRNSIFKSDSMRGRYAVTYVQYRLNKRFIPRLEYGGLRRSIGSRGIAIEDLNATLLREIVIATRQAKLPDPKVLGNAGSFFMNPIIPRSQYEALLSRFPDAPHYDVDEAHVKVPAGWLIDQTGWKGRSLGKAGVYEKQALVLVNLGGCKASDIITLSDTVRHDVKEKFGIDIHPEVNFI